ncbi:MAG: hypothetical protein JXD19_09850 [Deltaproteobacteria bacterium]|nr:hypothetical protein [Deltaproteobacteria bacterium]
MSSEKVREAKVLFEENVKLINPEAQPEMTRLYKGLLTLSEAVEDLANELTRLKRELKRPHR